MDQRARKADLTGDFQVTQDDLTQFTILQGQTQPQIQSTRLSDEKEFVWIDDKAYEINEVTTSAGTRYVLNYKGESYPSNFKGEVAIGEIVYKIDVQWIDREESPTFGSADALVHVNGKTMVYRRELVSCWYGNCTYKRSLTDGDQVYEVTDRSGHKMITMNGVMYDVTKEISQKKKFVISEKPQVSVFEAGQVIQANHVRYLVEVRSNGSIVFKSDTKTVVVDGFSDRVMLDGRMYHIYVEAGSNWVTLEEILNDVEKVDQKAIKVNGKIYTYYADEVDPDLIYFNDGVNVYTGRLSEGEATIRGILYQMTEDTVDPTILHLTEQPVEVLQVNDRVVS
ncbi:MAG: hypothetical protein UY10_C0025G0010, partial [Microgenomates group bacterium GW2011_GWA2_47_8]